MEGLRLAVCRVGSLTRTPEDMAAQGPGLHGRLGFGSLLVCRIWGFPKIRGTFLGVPIVRIIIFLDLYWGPLVLGNYHLGGFCTLRTPKLKPQTTLNPKP